MLKKSQLKRQSLAQLQQLLKQQNDYENIKVIVSEFQERKKKYTGKKQELQNILNAARKKTCSIVNQISQGTQQRVEKTEKLIFDSKSRPTKQDIRALTQLFNHFEKQVNLQCQNGQKMTDLSNSLQKRQNRVTWSSKASSYESDDNEYKILQKTIESQEQVKQSLLNQQSQNKKLYSTIDQSIQQYRVRYEQIESLISVREKELDTLRTYLKFRKNEDKNNLLVEQKRTEELESNLLEMQAKLNDQNSRKQEIDICVFGQWA